MTMVVPQPTAPPPAASTKPTTTSSSRIVGIDIARGLALLGMFAVHVAVFSPNGDEPDGIAAWLLAAPSGQASVLFFILSGVSLSFIAGRGSASAKPGPLRRRGAVLVIGGLLLSATFWGASILEHYGVMFLLAPWMLRRSNRTITLVAAASLVLGPIGLLLTAGRNVELASGLDAGVMNWTVQTVLSLATDGIYPLMVWVGFFLLGVRLGRLDLSSRRVAAGLVAIGVTVTLAVGAVAAQVDLPEGSGDDDLELTAEEAPLFQQFESGKITEEELDDKLTALYEDKDFEPKIIRDPTTLADTSPHSGRIGWTLRSSAIAVTILGFALLLPRRVQRLLRPLSALGSISLTAYLIHIVLVTDGWSLLVGDEPTLGINTQLGVLLGLQAVLVALASFIVWRWRVGPAERALKAISRPSP